jgi:hypothetical protein
MSPDSPPWRRLSLLGVWLAAIACTPPPATARATWTASELAAQSRCEVGDPAGCGELGRSLLLAHRDQRDVERALVLLEGACGRDDGASCAMLANWYAQGGGDSAQARARQLSTRACERGSGAACAQTRDGAPPERNPLATNRLEAQCGRGDGAACEALGFDAKRARALDAERKAFAEGCRLGRPLSCYLFGSLQMNEASSRSAGARLLEQKCLGGHAISCFSAMSYFAPKVGDRPSCARVRPLADRACQTLNYDRSDGCAMLDACQIEAKTDVAAAVKRLRDSCDDGISLACFSRWPASIGRRPSSLRPPWLPRRPRAPRSYAPTNPPAGVARPQRRPPARSWISSSSPRPKAATPRWLRSPISVGLATTARAPPAARWRKSTETAGSCRPIRPAPPARASKLAH